MPWGLRCHRRFLFLGLLCFLSAQLPLCGAGEKELIARFLTVVNSPLKGELEWTVGFKDNGSPEQFAESAELDLRNAIANAKKPLSPSEKEALRKEFVRKAREAYPFRASYSCKAIVLGASYLSTALGEPEGYYYSALLLNGRGVLLEAHPPRGGAGEETGSYMAEIDAQAPGMIHTFHPLMRLRIIAAGLRLERLTAEGGLAGGGRAVRVYDPVSRKEEAQIRFSERDSLPEEISVLGNDGSVSLRVRVAWTNLDGVWFPKEMDTYSYFPGGGLSQECHISLRRYVPRNVEEQELEIRFPVGTRVIDRTVSPPFSYIVDRPEDPGTIKGLRKRKLMAETPGEPLAPYGGEGVGGKGGPGSVESVSGTARESAQGLSGRPVPPHGKTRPYALLPLAGALIVIAGIVWWWVARSKRKGQAARGGS